MAAFVPGSISDLISGTPTDGQVAVFRAAGGSWVPVTLSGGNGGTVLRFGSGAPPNGLGSDGDSYVNTATGDYYLRASGSYTLQFNAKGPKGDKGDQGSPGTGSPSPFAVNVTLAPYGAVADGVTDNTNAFRAAVAAAEALIDAGAPGAFLYVPAGPKPYLIRGPVFVRRARIEVVGDGLASCVAMDGASFKGHDCFVFAWDQSLSPVPGYGDTAHRPDAFGKLDTSVATGAGQAFGYATNGDAVLVVQNQPLQLGNRDNASGGYDHWQNGSNILTLEVCFEFTGTPAAYPCHVGGLGSNDSQWYPAPWVLAFDDANTLRLHGRYADTPPETVAGPDLAVTGTWLTGVHRVAFQVNLNTGTVAAFAEKTQAATTSFTPFAAGKQWFANDRYPLMVGCSSTDAAPVGQPSRVSPLKVYGLRVSDSARYQANGVGTPQLRADTGLSPTDQWAYSGVDAHTLGFLGWDVPSTTLPYFTAKGCFGGAPFDCTGYWVAATNATPVLIPEVRCTVQNLQVNPAGAVGAALMPFNALELAVERVACSGGARSLGSGHASTEYTIRLERCWFSAFDAPIYAWQSILDVRRTVVQNQHRHAVRGFKINSVIDGLFISFVQSEGEYAVRLYAGDYGGSHQIAGINADNEGSAYTGGLIWAEGGSQLPTTLILDNNYVAESAGKPVIVLHDKGGAGAGTCELRAHFTQSGDGAYLVAVDGPNWHGNADPSWFNPAGTAIRYTGAGSANVTAQRSL